MGRRVGGRKATSTLLREAQWGQLRGPGFPAIYYNTHSNTSGFNKNK